MCRYRSALPALLLWLVMPARSDAAPPDAKAVAPSTRPNTPGGVDYEPMIREYQELARHKPADVSEYDRHLAAHPQLLTASAHPYGPTMMWLLEYEYADGVWALLRAGAKAPPLALAIAARGDMVELMKRFLDDGAKDDAQSTALQLAAKYGHVKALQLLIERGAKLGAPMENDGFTALHQAVIERRVDAVRVLLNAKAPLEVRDHNGSTPLHWAAYAYAPKPKHIYRKLGGPHDTIHVDVGEAKAMELLLKAGARTDAVKNDGNTALHEAAIFGSVRAATVLMAHGAKTNIKNREGKTPIDIAKERKMSDLVEILQGKR